MNRDDDKELWDLLGKAAEPKISPFFARNVIREIRQSLGHGHVRLSFNLRWLLPSISVAMAIIAAVIFLRTPPSMSNLARHHGDGAVVELSASDSELMADMDDLLASDDNNSWLDALL